MKKNLFRSMILVGLVTVFSSGVNAQAWYPHSNAADIIFGGGKVGINHGDPATEVHVLGDGGSLLGQITAQGAYNVGTPLVGFNYRILDANLWQTIVDNGNGNKFHIQSSGDASKRYFTLTQDGSVGIGTVNPGLYKLAVEGKIGAREVKVTLDQWADFVFKKDYKLRNLNEVEQFIKENNHLPEIPSEKEVLEDGVDLGAMQAKLLQKIEELTLYTIEQQKMIVEMREELDELKK